MPRSLENFERYPISVILSFLEEHEGIRLLICKKTWAKQLLPLFRLPPNLAGLNVVENLSQSKKQNRRHHYRFIVVPVQDASVRLQKLNTRRFKASGWRLAAAKERPAALAALQHWGVQHATLNQLSIPPILSFNKGPKSFSFRPGTTLLASYPRSGNTLVRTLLENVTGSVTGSDTRPDRTLSLALAERHGLVGEGLIHPSNTPVVKTHWPERNGFRPFVGHRIILLVRNPFDAIDSYWNLNVTNTHTEKVTDEVYERHRIFFRKLVLNEMKVWLEFLNFWRDQAAHAKIPILWMRYEDLILKGQREVMKLMEFATTQEGSFWEERIQQVLSQKRRQGYQSKTHQSHNNTQEKTTHGNERSLSASTSPFGRSLRRYDDALIQAMHDMDSKEESWLETFGYHVYNQGFPNNLTGQDNDTKCQGKSSDHELSRNVAGHVQVNQPRNQELRPQDSPFGRNMRDWRRSHTEQDTRPFPTVGSRNN